MNSYDQLIYLSEPKPQSHPAHLASIARLFGLRSSCIENARILELGSGTGGNIIPLAEHYPNSFFLGIDFSKKQTEFGNKIIKDLDYKNIELKHLNILEFQNTADKFDFIICHGVFSWVTKDVQAKILDIISSNLSENGLAYISYNTFPGWRAKQALREMMQYHTRNIGNPEERANQAKALLEFLIKSQTDPNTPYAQFLKSSFDELRFVPNYYLFHEYLEEQNQACYFEEFVSTLNHTDLIYLSDANFPLTTALDLPQDSQDLLRNLSDRLKQEQYLDFIRNRKMRESILCKKCNKPSYPQSPNLNDFYVSAELLSESIERQLDSTSYSIFRTASNGEIKSSSPTINGALRILKDLWPEQIKFEQLSMQLNLEAEQHRFLEGQFFHFYSTNLISLNLHRLSASAKNLITPKATKLARYMSLRNERASSNLHTSVYLEPIVAVVLSLLDGTRNTKEICTEIENQIRTKKLVVELAEEGDRTQFIETITNRSISFLSRKGFLT